MKIKYFYDPLCGWCYGASPALEKAETQGIEIEIYPTGLFAGQNGQLMSSDWAEYAWTNDQRIQKITGQIFSQDYRKNVLSNLNLRFDSWMPTLAIMANEFKFKGESLSFLRAIQKARYVDGLDNTNPEILANIAKDLGWDSHYFINLLLDKKFQQEALMQIKQNLAAYENYRTKGIPLIVIEENGEERILNSSFVFNKNPSPSNWSQIKNYSTMQIIAKKGVSNVKK